MDVHFELGHLRFVWDTDKASLNLAKHGIRFDKAAEVFSDPMLKHSDASVPEEDREGVVGQTLDGRLLFVVHIERDEGCIRMISARKAEPRERKVYENFG